MKKILIIDPDQECGKSLQLFLHQNNFSTVYLGDIQDTYQALRKDFFDLIILEVTHSRGSAIEFCSNIRNTGHKTPIIFISATADESSVVRAINAGGEDFIKKPLALQELKARINKILKNHSPIKSIKFGALSIDPSRKMVTIMGKIISLGRKELEILTILARRSGDIVSRETILNTLYESVDLYDRTIDSHMSHLRKKLREVAGPALQINSVYGSGYRLVWVSLPNYLKD